MEEILAVIQEIPLGCVATYGQIARLIGKDNNARQVGRACKMSSYYGEYPCHRVVNAKGRLVPDWLEQRELLKAEGVFFLDEEHVDLKRSQWRI